MKAKAEKFEFSSLYRARRCLSREDMDKSVFTVDTRPNDFVISSTWVAIAIRHSNLDATPDLEPKRLAVEPAFVP
jgi:hypothetical protein